MRHQEYDDLDGLDDDSNGQPLAAWYADQAAAVRRRLELDPPTDPTIRARLERDARTWRHLAAHDPAVAEHWASGEGDRKLF